MFKPNHYINFFLAKLKCIIEKISKSKELNTDFNVKIWLQSLQFIAACYVLLGELMLIFLWYPFLYDEVLLFYIFKYLFLMIRNGSYKKRQPTSSVMLIASISNICNGWYKKRFLSNTCTVHKFSNVDCIEWRIQEFQNGGEGGPGAVEFLGLGFVLMPLHTYPMWL